jgi:tetratricopeptide (TPR) repeat protein
MMGFIRDKTIARKRRAYVAHMLGGCGPCREAIAPTSRIMFRPRRMVEVKQGGPEYDGPVDRAVLFAIERYRELVREREEALALLARLPGEDWITISGSPGFPWTRGLCLALLERSWDLRHEDPREMLRFAGFACEAADRLDTRAYGKPEAFDLRARAWGEYGNACRVNDDLAMSEWALNRALGYCASGSRSLILRARLAELVAGLFSHQRQFQPALRALDLAHTLYVRKDQMHEAFRVQISRGIYTGRSGDPEMALLVLAKALMFANHHRIEDRQLRFVALHNILLFRVEHGDFAEARKQLFEMRPLYARYAGAVDSVKLRGIEARIAAGLGDHERAEKGFREVRAEFNNRGQVYHAAIMGLELAAVWLRQGRLPEVKRMIGDVLDIFRSLHVARETIAAVLMVREAVERERATSELIRRVASLLELQQDDGTSHTQP